MITLDGRRLSEFGMFVLQNHEHNQPQTQDVITNIPGRDGEVFVDSWLDSRTFNIPIGQEAADPYQREANASAFFRFLRDKYGKPREVKLIFDYAPDRYYLVRYTGLIMPDRLKRLASFTIPFRAMNPRSFSTVVTDEVTWGSTVLTFSNDYTFGHESPGIFDVSSPGYYYFPVIGEFFRPRIEIYGSADNLKLSCNGRTIEFSPFGNSSWVVDGDTYTVLKNNQNALFELVGNAFDPIEFFNGMNILHVTGVSFDVQIAIRYRDEFL